MKLTPRIGVAIGVTEIDKMKWITTVGIYVEINPSIHFVT